MTSSSGTNRGVAERARSGRRSAAPSPARSAPCRSWGCGSHREVEREPGDVGERVRRVDGERREHREDPVAGRAACSASARRVSRSSHRTSSMPCVGERGHDLLAEERGLAPLSSRVDVQMLSSTSRGISPEAARTARPAAIRRLSPATRTMKNSSRLLVKIARNRTRSSSGMLVVLGQLEHPLVEVQPRQLAVEEAVVELLDRGERLVVRRVGHLDLEVSSGTPRDRRQAAARCSSDMPSSVAPSGERQVSSGRGPHGRLPA